VDKTAITISDLGFAYTTDRWVVRHLTTVVRARTVFALLGPNGGGKTTFLHLLAGALRPQEGSIEVSGRVAFIPQLFEVSFDFTALDMVLMGRAPKIGLFSQPSAKDHHLAMAALNRFDLADLAARPFHEMSGGQRQLVVFARALVAEADILVLDEPTSALDLKNQALVLEWISSLRDDGLTIVMSTHHPHHALAIADDVLLTVGEPPRYTCGAAADVLTENNLATLYGVPLIRVTAEHAGQQIESFAQVLPTRLAAPGLAAKE
jgi:iron complex transport system ATP-binding protein